MLAAGGAASVPWGRAGKPSIGDYADRANSLQMIAVTLPAGYELLKDRGSRRR